MTINPHLRRIVHEDNRRTVDEIRAWVSQNKITSVGMLWLSGMATSIAFSWPRPHMKSSVKIMHARIHPQALTLGALLAAAGLVNYGQVYISRNFCNTSTHKGYD
ncbi:hypothetical protein KP509_22G027500 [Ceratopteris richardii]|uniref:HIG1 domain-containing protein n=1 Tax=Ceratopteris richardii TaxID=49495 RepID=A0A8T2S6U2_CERRI|nr:hypothetical protein KP509_22G027500 [Ceratopteris richardii]